MPALHADEPTLMSNTVHGDPEPLRTKTEIVPKHHQWDSNPNQEKEGQDCTQVEEHITCSADLWDSIPGKAWTLSTT